MWKRYFDSIGFTKSISSLLNQYLPKLNFWEESESKDKNAVKLQEFSKNLNQIKSNFTILSDEISRYFSFQKEMIESYHSMESLFTNI